MGITLASAAWAVSTPLGGSPDEPAHIIKAVATVRGEWMGKPTSQAAVTRVTVPESYSQAKNWPCYAFNPNVSANCVRPPGDNGTTTSAETSAGLYNPMYYLMVGWPSLLTDNAKLGVIAMRVVSGLVVSLFLSATLMALLSMCGRRLASITFAALLTPMVLFLSGAVNPNGLEIAAGASLMTALLHVATQKGRNLGLWLAVVAVSGSVLANTRGISPLWVAVIGVVGLIYAPKGVLATLLKKPAVLSSLAVVVLSTLLAVAWIVATGTLSSMGSFPGAGQTSPLAAFEVMLLDRTFDPGTIGVFGWLDTWAPSAAYVLWTALGVVIVVFALILARGRQLVALLVSAVGFVLIPAIVQAASVAKSGYIWQGRYALVGYVATIIVAGVAISQSSPSGMTEEVRRRLTWLTVTAAVLVNVFAMVVAIKRYAVGTAGAWSTLIKHPLWLPPGGLFIWPAVLLVGLGLVAYIAVFERDGRNDSASGTNAELGGPRPSGRPA